MNKPKPVTYERSKRHDPNFHFIDTEHNMEKTVEFQFGIRVLLLAHKYNVEIISVEPVGVIPSLKIRLRGMITSVDDLNNEAMTYFK